MTELSLLRVAAEVCRAAARGEPLPARAELAEPGVLEGLLRVGAGHRCLPLLAPALEKVSPAENVRRQLTEISAAAWASYELTSATVGPLLQEARRRGLGVIVYKGAAQAARFYREPWRRQMQDIDLLVRASDVSVLRALLADAGYRIIAHPKRSRSAELSHEWTFRHSRAGIRMIDVHTHPAPPTRHRFDYQALEAGSTEGEVFGTAVRLLAVEDELVVAAVNQAYDHFRGSLLRAVDGALICDGANVDWNRVLDGARAAGARVATWLTLRWMRDLAGASVPGDVIRDLEPDRIRRWWLAAMLSSGVVPAPRLDLPRRLEQALLTFGLMDDFRQFLEYVARHGTRRGMDAWRAVIRGE